MPRALVASTAVEYADGSRQGHGVRVWEGSTGGTDERFCPIARFTDHVQWRYEVIRPLVLFEDRTVSQRARNPTSILTRCGGSPDAFSSRGMLGLFPDTVDVVRPSRGDRSRKPPPGDCPPERPL